MRSRATSPCRASLLGGSPRSLCSPSRSCRPRWALQCRSLRPRRSRPFLLALRSIPEVSPVVTLTYCPKGLARRFGKVLAALLQDLFLAMGARADDIVLETRARTLRLASLGAAGA